MSGWMQIAREMLVVAAVALGVGLAANALSPRGLRLDRDYFPKGEAAADVGGASQPAAVRVGAPGDNGIAARLDALGIATATAAEVLAWLHDPQYQAGLIVFVDARDEDKYRTAHIPGAWAFNHYRVDEELPKVLPACLGAMKVVVYCGGGQCEDSEFAAIMLRDAGVPRENLAVYVGGLAEWTAKKYPLEAGSRGSGQAPALPK